MNFRTLDLNLLRVFDTVMAEGSITRAAERLAMTQPAVSNALKRLRDSVGEDLLTRAARGVAPTAFGEALWPQVRSALGQLRAALEPGDFDPALDARVFRLTMADAMAAFLLPALMARFATLGARCQIEVRPLLDRDPRELLAHADIDVALGHFPEVLAALAAQGRVAPLRHRRLGEGRYVCVMRAGHPLAGAPLTLAAFCAAERSWRTCQIASAYTVPGSTGSSRTTSRSSSPVSGRKRSGSTVSRSERATTCAAVKNWLTVSATRRLSCCAASAWSTKPCGRPLKLTSTCSAAQKAASVSGASASGCPARMTQT